jgi:hypothetical protein
LFFSRFTAPAKHLGQGCSPLPYKPVIQSSVAPTVRRDQQTPPHRRRSACTAWLNLFAPSAIRNIVLFGNIRFLLHSPLITASRRARASISYRLRSGSGHPFCERAKTWSRANKSWQSGHPLRKMNRIRRLRLLDLGHRNLYQSEPSDARSCAKSCRSQTRQSTKWNSAANFRSGSF